MTDPSSLAASCLSSSCPSPSLSPTLALGRLLPHRHALRFMQDSDGERQTVLHKLPPSAFNLQEDSLSEAERSCSCLPLFWEKRETEARFARPSPHESPTPQTLVCVRERERVTHLASLIAALCARDASVSRFICSCWQAGCLQRESERGTATVIEGGRKRSHNAISAQ